MGRARSAMVGAVLSLFVAIRLVPAFSGADEWATTGIDRRRQATTAIDRRGVGRAPLKIT